MKVMILAGNYQQAKFHCAQRGIPPHEWAYVQDDQVLRGIRKGDLVLVGTYYDRPDCERLMNLARSHEMNILRAHA